MWVENFTRGGICKRVKVQRKILDDGGEIVKVEGISEEENIG